jgi:hypothetical protein
MRTTIRIDDDLLKQLKDAARQENISLGRLINRTLRRGLAADGAKRHRTRRYREKVYSMGKPEANLDKALLLASALEDEGVLDKLARRK